METITISGTNYDSYGSQADATTYLAAALHAGTDWTGAADTSQKQALVTATRILDRQTWQDAYNMQALRLAVPDIVNACYEMALALVQGSELQTEANTAQKLASIRAGSVALTYFRGAEGAPHRFPQIVHELLKDYLGGTGLTVSATATGVSGTPSTSDDFGHTGGI